MLPRSRDNGRVQHYVYNTEIKGLQSLCNKNISSSKEYVSNCPRFVFYNLATEQ